jgi:hypothetical protein
LIVRIWQTVCNVQHGLKLFLRHIFVLVLAFSSLSFQQQPNFDPVAKGKAIFLYNFTRYFEWPEKMKSGNFIIQVIGSNPNINQELNKMAAVKQVGSQKLEIKANNTIDINMRPHIIYILNDASDVLKEVASKFKGKGALIVTEKNGLARAGAAINFVAIDNKQKFEYNKGNAVAAGLKTSDELKTLAIAVD